MICLRKRCLDTVERQRSNCLHMSMPVGSIKRFQFPAPLERNSGRQRNARLERVSLAREKAGVCIEFECGSLAVSNRA